MTRDRLALVLLATALSAAACAAPSIDSIEDEIVVPKRVSGASGSDDEADPNAQAGSGSNSGSTKSADTTGAPTSTGGASTPPPPPVGKWMQANGQDCVAFCTQAGKTNVASNDGAKCTSGENIPASAIAAGITYDKCFPSCAAHVSNDGSPVSNGKYCYSTGQKHDDDASDVTRGCFCK